MPFVAPEQTSTFPDVIGTPWREAASGITDTVVFVAGMDCGHCIDTLQEEVDLVAPGAGFRDVRIHGTHEEAWASVSFYHGSDDTSLENLSEAIGEAGFQRIIPMVEFMQTAGLASRAIQVEGAL
jgi:copper chaperone CopZ